MIDRSAADIRCRGGPVLFPFPFVLVGQAENFLHGRPDLNDAQSAACKRLRPSGRTRCTRWGSPGRRIFELCARR